MKGIAEEGDPCGYYEDENAVVATHCWRTYTYYNDGTKCECSHSGVHWAVKSKGDRKEARAMAAQAANKLIDGWGFESLPIIEETYEKLRDRRNKK